MLKFVPIKERVGRIYIPNAAGNVDTHRMGVIEALGNGVKGSLKVGDTVVFQINDVMKWSQIYRRIATGDDLLHLLESELIARVDGNEVRPDTIHILGDYVLFEPVVKQPDSTIILPDKAGLTPEYVRYIMLQKGSGVDLPIEKGQEVIINHGRVSALLVQYTNRHGDTENKEFGYTLKEWICGCLEEKSAEPSGLIDSESRDCVICGESHEVGNCGGIDKVAL